MSKSVARDLKTLETRVRERMDELAPQLEEWGELTEVAGKLGIEVPSLDGTGTAGAEKKVTRRKRASGKRTRRPRTDYKPLLEAKIKEQPGTSPSRLAEMVGDERKSSTYRIVRRWKDEGTIEERDGGVVWTA